MNKMKHSANEKNEIQRMKLIKLIRARLELTMYDKVILGMELVYNNDFFLHCLLTIRPIHAIK